MNAIAASITAPQGFQAAGVACGLKKDGRPDLALVVSDYPATVAGVFTRNLVKGHSLQLSQDNCRGGVARAVVVNSGNANAAVGEPGLQDARTMAASVASLLGCPDTQVLTGSTGVIGKRLDMDAVTRGIGAAYSGLSASADAGHQAEQAIMTTDRVPKESAVCLDIGGKTVTIAGMAKGSGMIHPNMATMIALLTTDCAVSSELLGKLLRRVADRTFNRVSVDGDTSVCDMVLVLANGAAG
ncbi:MAG TPA: ornithine acetyltransferase, partial [Clostridiales bacterium]|nr:ornithine acetyltransferase [Clostridiales bacterium]